MPCENYREALIEAAATGAAPSRELRLHMDACASCSAAFAEELQLFVAIDSGVRATANSEVPASLLPRVRARLNEHPATRRFWIPAWAAVAAVAALVFAASIASGDRATKVGWGSSRAPQLGSAGLVKTSTLTDGTLPYMYATPTRSTC